MRQTFARKITIFSGSGLVLDCGMHAAML